MIAQEVYRNPDRLSPKFDFARDGRETLQWLRFMWSWNKDKKARRAAEVFGRKLRAWEKKKADGHKDEKGRIAAIKKLNKMLRGE